jgi:hypothetical protein
VQSVRRIAGAGLWLLIAAMLVGAAPAQSSATEKGDRLARLINQARVSEGLKPLARSRELDRAAEQHSQDMARQSYLDHTAPDGSEPMDRAIQAGYGARKGTGWIVVEVISAISGEPEGPLDWWLKESPAVHGKVLRNPRWREMGVGYAAGGEYGNYWTVLVGCQPRVLPVVELDGASFRHEEECDVTEAPAPANVPRVAAAPRVDAGGATEVEVRWQGVPQPRPNDWIGLFRPSDPDALYLAFSYLGCAAAEGEPREDGACALKPPPSLESGEYEVRLLRFGGLERVARSEPVALRLPTVPPTASVSAPAGSVRAGEPLHVAWSGVPSPSRRDWLALTSLAEPAAAPSAWAYVSCRGAPDRAYPGGTCDLDVPPTTRPGTYELKLLADDAHAPWASTTVVVAPPGGADGNRES